MNRQEALRQVAGHTAAQMGAGSLEEASGVDQYDLEQLSDADQGRLEWAVGEVQRRLSLMGEPRPPRVDTGPRTR